MKHLHHRLLSACAALMALAMLFGMFAVPASAAIPPNAAADIVRLVNAERAKVGLPALSNSYTALQNAAQKRATELPLRIDATHRRPDGRECFTVLEEYGITSFSAAGENIAAGQTSAAQVMTDWMNSSRHKANILGNFTDIGVGVYESGGRLFWSQEFLRTGSSAAGGGSASQQPTSFWAKLVSVLTWLWRVITLQWLRG